MSALARQRIEEVFNGRPTGFRSIEHDVPHKSYVSIDLNESKRMPNIRLDFVDLQYGLATVSSLIILRINLTLARQTRL